MDMDGPKASINNQSQFANVSVEEVMYDTTISESLRHFSDTLPDKKAFVFVKVDEASDVITWKELYEKSVKAARGLMQLGVKRREFVAVNIRSCPEWLFVNFGVILAGARIVNIAFTYSDGSDVVAMMEKLETCSTMVLDAGGDENNWNIFQNLLDEHSDDGTAKSAVMPYLRHLVLLKQPSNTTTVKTFNELVQNNCSDFDLPKLDKNEIVLLFQTSGSTGIPKVVAHTHQTLSAFAWSMNRLEFGRDTVDPGCEVIYNDRPFTWGAGWPYTVFFGVTRVTRNELGKNPEDYVGFIFDAIKRERCGNLFALPPILHAITERQAEVTDDWPLRHIGTSSQPLTRPIAECVGLLCKRLSSAYGGTEFDVTAAITVNHKDQFQEYSCGHVLPGVAMKIVDESDTIVPLGTRGEIYLKSTAMFREYWNDPQKTALVKTADGWFKTDDIGYVSKDGSLFVEGRKSDMIISGGMNVNPVILERAIGKYPGVRAVVIVPVRHPVLYQVVCACVTADTGSDITEDALRRHCDSIHNDKPGHFTVLPTYYLMMEKFSETSTGKTSRKQLALMVERILKP